MRIKLFLAVGVLAVVLPRPAAAAPMFWSSADGGNDHYYELVEVADPISWAGAVARAATAAFTKDGTTFVGYLATVTSTDEQRFIDSALFASKRPVYWLGGTDAAVEGEWRWATGPESGQLFWLGDAAGAPPVGAYANWAGGEPNNQVEDEHYLVGNWTADGQWNDAFGGAINQAYVVEYEASVPEPGTLVVGALGVLVTLGRRLTRRSRA